MQVYEMAQGGVRFLTGQGCVTELLKGAAATIMSFYPVLVTATSFSVKLNPERKLAQNQNPESRYANKCYADFLFLQSD